MCAAIVLVGGAAEDFGCPALFTRLGVRIVKIY